MSYMSASADDYVMQAVPKRGQDPQHDAQEKALLKTATRCPCPLLLCAKEVRKEKRTVCR